MHYVREFDPKVRTEDCYMPFYCDYCEKNIGMNIQTMHFYLKLREDNSVYCRYWFCDDNCFSCFVLTDTERMNDYH